MDKHKIGDATGQLVKVLLSPDDLGRPFFGPPGVPADRVKMLREAFAKIMHDPDVVAEAQKKGLDPNLVSGDELEGLIKELIALPPEVIQRMKKLMEKPA
jgi:tripartite-type tricarboxylate transporter receptor subunit TctC